MTSIVQSCPSRDSALWISVLETSRYEAIEGARVTVKGSAEHEGTTSVDGTLAFESIEPGDYEVEVDGLKMEAKMPAAQQCTTTKGGRETLVFRVEFLDWDLGELCIVGAAPASSASGDGGDWDIGQLCIVGAAPVLSAALDDDGDWELVELRVVGAPSVALPATVDADDAWDLGALQLRANAGS